MSSENNFSSALATWKDINLSELQKTLDEQGLEIVENQKESIVVRKALAERTKDFKKIPDDEKLNAWKGLLKSYQTEIDNLTKRSKTSDNAFLSLYKKLAEAPDPYPLLEATVEHTIKASKTSQLEEEVAKLREENANLNRKLDGLSNLESAKKKADAQIQQLEERMDEKISERVAQKENELSATYDEKLRNYEDREKDLVRQLSLAQKQLRDMKTSNETNQARLMDQSQRQDQETLAKFAEMDMIVAELERANNRAAAAERRNELLRAEIEAVRSGSEASSRIAPLEEQIAELTSESERLGRVLESQKHAATDVETSLKKTIADQSNALTQKDGEINTLRERLQERRDYDEIKRELDIMKYVEFGGMDDEDAGHEPDNELGLSLLNPATKKAEENKPLEVLLASKNARITEELTRLRVLQGDNDRALQELSDELRITRSELEEKRSLCEKLEMDLLQLDQHKPNGVHDSGAATPSDVLSDLDIGGKKSKDGTPARSTPIPFASSVDTSILPIVTSQRDRFRLRNAELEEELRKQFQIISDLRSEAKSLQVDNLKLYEKVRYMQSYREESSSSALSAARQDDLNKYHARYEESMNPFEAFRGREAVRAFQALNPVEKAVLSLTRVILGSRRARNIFVFYALSLHLLVMITTYELTMSSGTELRTQPRPF
ncbi:hypothetical protein SCHPADRAFT_1002727 [Schizopora paradoxa]|uniref:Protein CASP n=1 Tax=Schizopora paradoxa TaxID=27342 RepID=A0A0H2R1T8_9AGAM|nr:hypothetical protein SCHPADRAFT_1002727 [Schizopora paradoxa]